MATFQPINPLDFLKELFVRIGKKSPKFFRILQYVLTASCVIAGVPALLQYFQVQLPEAISVLSSKLVSVASFVGLFIASLPVDQAPEIAIQKPTSLPVTAKDENNKIVKDELAKN